MRAMYSADMDSLVMFNFPLERLPTYTQASLLLGKLTFTLYTQQARALQE